MRGMTTHLAPGQLWRVDATSRVAGLRVIAGTVWLTTTPADGDVILHAGDRLTIVGGWPIVVEALAPSTIVVTRPGSTATRP